MKSTSTREKYVAKSELDKNWLDFLDSRSKIILKPLVRKCQLRNEFNPLKILDIWSPCSKSKHSLFSVEGDLIISLLCSKTNLVSNLLIKNKF